MASTGVVGATVHREEGIVGDIGAAGVAMLPISGISPSGFMTCSFIPYLHCMIKFDQRDCCGSIYVTVFFLCSVMGS